MKLKVKRWWWLPIPVVLIFGISMLFGAEGKVVPQEFSEARIEGARLAGEIVAASTFSLERLRKIGELDRKGSSQEALILIGEEIQKNKEIQDKAIALSSQLERMAILVSEIKPTRARGITTEALTAEVGLVSRLVNYNGYFSELFNVLRTKFVDRTVNVDGKVSELITKINEEARAINDLNDKFTSSLAEFDKVFGSKWDIGVSYTGSTRALGARRPGSIPGTPTKSYHSWKIPSFSLQWDELMPL